MSEQPPWEKVNPLASLRDKAFSGTKTGRDDYAAGLITLAETYAWYLAMNSLIAACESALNALRTNPDDSADALIATIEAALAKARGDAHE